MRALSFLSWRLVQALPVTALVIVLNFCLMKLAPGDMADVLAGEAGAATPETMAQLRSQFGTDQPLPAQFAHYVGRLAHFDLGWSYSFSESVANLILGRLGATLLLSGAALLIAVVAGCLLGVLVAVTRRAWVRNLIEALSLLGFAMPVFWIALMAVVAFTVRLGWLPSNGMVDMAADYHGLAHVADLLRHMAMPVLCLAFSYLALYTRLMSDAVRDVALLDFVRTARATGASRARLIWRHVVPNALLPVVTLTGVQCGALLSGSVTVETVFAWPGLGQLALAAVTSRDVNLLLGILFVASLFVVLVNVLTEVLQAWLDPRVGAGGR